MSRKNFLIRLVSLIFFIFLANYLAMKFYWYSSVWYLDMPMHFLGGFWLGLAVVWFLKFKEVSGESIFKIIFIVLLIGVLWEAFEIIVNKTITGSSFNILDTVSDMFFDAAGGLSAILYFSKHAMFFKENTLQLKNGKYC